MKRFWMLCFTIISFSMLFAIHVAAEVTNEELQSYSTKTGLSEKELLQYLSVNDLSLNDFRTVDELVSYLGEPVTEDTLQTLLGERSISKSELDNILSGFGETINDYLFIKDLETTVDFYLHNAEVLAEAKHMLSDLGLTQDEIDKLFMHFLTLEETSLDNKMKMIRSNLENYFSYNNDSSKFTSEQQKELLSTYDMMIDTFELTPVYYLTKKESKEVISYTDLIERETLDGSDLLVELYNANKEYLLDLRVTEDMLTSDFILERGEKLLTVATLANQMSISVKGEKLPDTASSTGNNIAIAMIMIITGLGLHLLSKRKALI